MNAPVLLQTRKLTRHFGGLHAVSELDLDVRAGEIVCVIGPNGAGKSTTFNLIAGALAPSAGSLMFDDEPMNGKPAHEVAAMGIARTFQHNHPFAGMSITENVMVGMHRRLRKNFWQALLHIREMEREEHAARARAEELLGFVGLSDFRDADVSTLSFGQGRLLEIARCMASRPKLMLLDEPAGGLTHDECDHLSELVRRVAEQGVAVLLIEHDMRLVMSLAQRIVVLNFGIKIAEGTPDEIRCNAKVTEAYLGNTGGLLHA